MALSRNLTQFSKRLALRSQQVLKSTQRIVREAAVTGGTVAITATPVDTGLARSGWIPTIGAPATEVPVDSPGVTTATTTALGKVQAVAAVWKISDPPIFITNNVPYIEALDNGSSSQAPAGMTDQAVAAANRVMASGRIFSG